MLKLNKSNQKLSSCWAWGLAVVILLLSFASFAGSGAQAVSDVAAQSVDQIVVADSDDAISVASIAAVEDVVEVDEVLISREVPTLFIPLLLSLLAVVAVSRRKL